MRHPVAASILALSLGLSLSACGGIPTNRSMNSVHQPVIERSNFTIDVATGGGGLAYGEQRRLAGWLEAMNLKYGDRVYVDDPSDNPATRAAVEAALSRYGVLLSELAPPTEGYINAGTARVIINRTSATVPGCPDWSSHSDFNPNNGLSSNYGCATNSNLASMIANPEDLLQGADGTGSTAVMSNAKAIESYRKAAPTGGGNTVSTTTSKGN